MKKKTLILGAGPAGMMAAHAAVIAGHDVSIFSKKRKSELFGCQYLHAPIPFATNMSSGVEVIYALRGSITGYRRKVYGDRKIQVSPEALEESHMAWDIRHTYDVLWAAYHRLITNVDLTGGTRNPAIKSAVDEADYVFSTVPAPVLCNNDEHTFEGEKVWAIGDAPERGVFNPIDLNLNNEVVLNGLSAPSWYRTASVFGYSTTEWPHDKRPPIEGVAEVIKPIKTNCNCHPKITRLGRYGQWKKGVLSHEAFFAVRDEIGPDNGRLF